MSAGRAQRRRIERELGRKRSDRKKGRRTAIRTPLIDGLTAEGWRIPRSEVSSEKARR